MIGLIDVDGHNFPNFALMRIGGYLRDKGILYEWAQGGLFQKHYDEIWASKIFTFSEDVDWSQYSFDKLHRGGTGYDIKSRLPEEIEKSLSMDYNLYPQYPFSIQFFSRGCIRHCPFCLVRDKEGYIYPVDPVELNPNGRWIEVLDNNFFANPEWRKSIEYIKKVGQPINLHGVDLRIMDEEQAHALKSIKLHKTPHLAWDLPQIDLTEQLVALSKYMHPGRFSCYVLIGYNSTLEQDLYRINTLKRLKFNPFVQPYRDFENKRKVLCVEKDLARWANNKFLFNSCDFEDYEPRKGFKCIEYFKHPELRLIPYDERNPLRV